MSSTPRRSAELFVEPLEARIAPTGLVAITDPNGVAGKGDPRYVDYSTPAAPGKLGFVHGSDYGVAGADIYAMLLTGTGAVGPDNLNTGDKLVIYNSVLGFNFANPFVQSANGNVVAFFRDANHDGLVSNDELVGIAMGKAAAVNVNGTVHGDIVGDLPATGAINFGAALKLKQTISGINVVGDVTGAILAGGTINNVTINGDVGGIFTGTAANGVDVHFGDPGVVSGTVFTKVPKANHDGPSITNLNVISIGNGLRTGDGGLHGDAGSIINLAVQNDVDGFSLATGNGGDGNVLAHAGKGGRIDTVLVRGVPDHSGAGGLGTIGTISITTGHGGFNPDHRGGKGGAIANVAISYDTFDFGGDVGLQSIDFSNDNVVIHAGDGGVGHRGGVGGAVNAVFVATVTVDNPGALNGVETQILSGSGGASTVAGTGRGGRGGVMNLILAENFLVPTPTVGQGSIFVQSGSGAATGSGGAIGGVTLLGNELAVLGGNGGDGYIHGGAGGSIDTVNILTAAGIFANDLTLNAGRGGFGSNGKGGDGGSVSTVQVIDSQLHSLTVNGGTQGNAGDSANGVGGNGGTVTNLQINDSGPFLAQGAPVIIRTGNGGNGSVGGGLGGDLNTIQMIGTDLAYTVQTGNGGSVTGGGAGDAGLGGAIVNVGISNQPVDVTTVTLPSGQNMLVTQISNGNTATVITGNGGSAAAGLGGTGGDITKLNVTTFVNITPQPNLTAPAGFQADNYTVTSGSGGTGGAGAGKGGDITASAAFSVFGSVTVRSGDAGVAGGATANGGMIDGFVTAGLSAISLTAGNGGAGGVGGSILNSGTNLVPVTTTDFFGVSTIRLTNNTGGLTVHAGNGSVGNGSGGVGGSVDNFAGYISSGGLTSITAGNGGGNTRRTGTGGDVDTIKLIGVHDGLSTGSLVTIDAGNAGATVRAKRGADGGSASNITIYNVDPGTVVHHIAAGDASTGRRTVGAGGDVTAVHVGTAEEGVDIGYRDGHGFGYDNGAAGGIFAGLGGVGGTPGNVTDVTAAAIASIVAGKTGVQLANKVDAIFLEGLTPTRAAGDGSFTNFDAAQAAANGLPVANLVGSVLNPFAPNASHFVLNQDGLIAALNLTGNRNFVPEAYATLDGNNQLVVVDVQQPSAVPVVFPI